jgi:vacuolar-type H+-ATPase subunit I/STV1
MRRLLLTILITGTFAGFAHSQELGDRVRVLRAEVYARVLNLTPEEAEKFWPIFNEYAENKESLQKQLRSEGDLDGMSDQEVEDYVKKYFEVRQKEFDLEKDLVQKLRKVLPVRKIAKLPKAEREFRESLLKRLQELREKRQERRAGGKN